MTTDTELERWQQEWREHTDPLPELKKKIRRQNWQTAAAIVAICACIVLSTLAAIQDKVLSSRAAPVAWESPASFSADMHGGSSGGLGAGCEYHAGLCGADIQARPGQGPHPAFCVLHVDRRSGFVFRFSGVELETSSSERCVH